MVMCQCGEYAPLHVAATRFNEDTVAIIDTLIAAGAVVDMFSRVS